MFYYKFPKQWFLILCIAHFSKAQFPIQALKQAPFIDSSRVFFYPKLPTMNANAFNDVQACYGLSKEIYCAWLLNDSLCFQRSLDGGTTWLIKTKVLNAAENAGNYMLDGIAYKGHPSILCDTLSTNFKNRIYICWSDEKHGAKNKNVFLIYSDDKGQNWTEPILITYFQNHKDQFSPLLSLNKTDGTLYIAYFDKQNYLSGKHCDVYVALSRNGGLQYEYYKLNAATINTGLGWKPELCISQKNDTLQVSWMELSKQKKPLYFQVLFNKLGMLAYNQSQKLNEIRVEKSFQFAPKISIPFYCNQNLQISAVIHMPTNPAYEKIVCLNKQFLKGNNVLLMEPKKLGLQKNNYTVTLYYQQKNTYVWITSE